jgi:ribosome-associated protein
MMTPPSKIPDTELRIEFVRSSGPGGQNVNKLATKVRLSFEIGASTVLTEEEKARLRRSPLCAPYLTSADELMLTSQRERSQAANIRDVLERFHDLVATALVKPKRRRKTRPTKASKERRLASKRAQKIRKSQRGPYRD